MTTGIQSGYSLTSMQATSYTTATQEDSTEAAVVSTGTESANYDTYTPSAEAIAVMSASEEVADTTVEDTTVEDTTVDDTKVEDTTVEDTTVEDTEVEDSEEEELPSESDSLDSLVDDYASSYEVLSGTEMKLTLMANQMNTLTTMLNVMNGDDDLYSQSWINDASTFNYAGKYLAKSAAGTHDVQLNQESAESTVAAEKSYNEYSTTEQEGALSYEELLEKYEVDNAADAADAVLGKSEE